MKQTHTSKRGMKKHRINTSFKFTKGKETLW